ncbi:CHAT domain-containing protein [Nocardioides antri]|uniref:CHAT domain-containing protein n=1 Tax=Nocardioides antri TaxID=2607659 RepID=A0A5B1LU31_9ACTN|nr:CHAT domain-containing protein [Nocardioides antri]KAA1424046.1 CHAT domain-containing protein [Nocardioides antri]
MQDLLDLAIEDPDRGRREAEIILAGGPDDLTRSYAHQCLGIALREKGRTEEAIAELRRGIRAARASGSADRERDIRATYGGTLAYAGRTRAALKALDKALDGAGGEVGATIRMRKAGVLALLGRHDDAVPEMRAALEDVVDLKNQHWEARTRTWLSHLELRLGRLDAAEVEARRAAEIFTALGSTLEWLTALENLAEIAIARGDLVSGLSRYADVADGYRKVEQPMRFVAVVGHATAYLAVGLAEEAAALLETTVDRERLPVLEQAEFDLLRAAALLAAGDAERARAVAEDATVSLRRQQRRWYRLRAQLVGIQARYALDDRSGLGRGAAAVARSLDDERADEAPVALVLAGRVAAAENRRQLLGRALAYRDRANGVVRASAWLAGALECEDRHDRGGLLRACTAGLDAIDEHRRLMGSSELRALATTHGKELTEVALRHAAHDPRTLLRWSERTRATALAQPPATSDAATIPASLAALRDNGRRLAEARQAGEPTEELEKERLRLERAVRTEHHTQAAADSDPQRPASAEEIVAGVGEGCLVELVDVDGVLHVLVVHDGRVRRKVAGTTAEVADLLGPAGMLLRRASRGRPASTADLGRRLQEAILGDAARLIPDGPVTLAPTARLHGLAWSLLPTLQDRPFGVVPSAGQWLRAKSVRRPRRRRTLLVAGPGLESGGAEVPVLAERHPDAVLLDGAGATLAAVLEQLDGADLAHLATHGRFRADSPLFSSLDLADGPLTVHDLERLRRAPYRMVLSACESGVLAPVGAQELLGLAAALFSIGTAGLVSSVAEVNDAATADLMVGLHDALGQGRDPATALRDVRRAAADDPVATGTAAAFVALGV